MNLEKIYQNKSFSPWVFVTYDCSCRCPYCMIPKTERAEKTMSPETFRKMLEITEKLFEKDVYDHAHFRLSGGEPFLVFKSYKDTVTEYRKKYPQQMHFGMLTNFVNFSDEIADWMEENNIGMQISLDDLVNGKPLNNGESSSEKVLENVQKVMARDIGFSFNTVLDIEKTKDLTKLANYVSRFGNIEWGLNASYTDRDADKVEEVIKVFDGCLFQLVKRGFDIGNRLRFYNTKVGQGEGGCTAGVNSFGIGTNLEVWPCQSLCDGEPIGYFDEEIKQTLMTSSKNAYFRERKLMSECSDCSILGLCRGGCRATHGDDGINDAVCRIRRNIIEKIYGGYYYRNGGQNCNRHRFSQCQCDCPRPNDSGGDSRFGECANGGIGGLIEDYVAKLPDKGDGMLVDTPALD
jgi:radical SAM protein with 4Fe4S-binding SPASM domain